MRLDFPGGIFSLDRFVMVTRQRIYHPPLVPGHLYGYRVFGP